MRMTRGKYALSRQGRYSGALVERPECTFDGLELEGRASCGAAAIRLRVPLLHDVNLNGLGQGATKAAT